MVEIQPIRLEVEREADDRIVVSIPELPGVTACGETEAEAVRAVKAMALRVLADRISSGQKIPESLRLLFRV